jgi:single-strand selective monofunctional uracil DNA glycosylase
MNETSPPERLIAAVDELCSALEPLRFAEPVTHVYNPLLYARAPHEMYLRKHGACRKKVVLLGMNPGPWGMAQTGVPFGEITAVRDWIGVSAPVSKPPREHPKRPILGFDCAQSEVSGRRLWGLFAQRFGTAEAFFREHFVANYCPLVFMETSGKNFTPDKLPVAEAAAVNAACDAHLEKVIRALEPEWLIGVGGYAEQRALVMQEKMPGLKVGRILHPSPASPAANRDWAGVASRQMTELGVW